MTDSPAPSPAKDPVGPTAPHDEAPSTAPDDGAVAETRSGAGLAMVVGCYVLWGFFPLFFRLLDGAGAVEIIGHRVIWTLASCLVLVVARGGWGRLRAVVTTPRLLGTLTVSGFLITANWLIYVYGVNTGHTADAALGYFVNPLVTVALAAVFLGERLRPAQGVSIALASVAVLILVAMQHSLPWVSLGLALSFGFYGLVKKRVSARVDALTGLTVESLVVAPVALAYLGWRQATGAAAMQGPEASPLLLVLLLLAGPLTAIPLLLFGAGTARVPLSVVGLSQYIAPIMQFLLAWGVFHEEISTARWIAMCFVWAGVAVFAADLLRQLARRPRLRPRS
ncbi:EamA family transporter RarD [Actinomyces haliotis]|uniref:EamA family transporter RarD n=1 Tax=Actinomyces haliotis TaxID=1280843 RepID=UPI00188DDE99|nr:EamA family transporter RarD [Actinomyces haliotis]